MKTYIALTIGPIFKTLSNAKKTKELWSGSYIFSYIMREIIRGFKDTTTIVIPAIDENLFDSTKKLKDDTYIGAGFFHDRFIFESKSEDSDKLKKLIDTILDDLASDINKHFEKALHIHNKKLSEVGDDTKKYYQDKILEINSIDKKEVTNFLKEYFQIYFLEKEAKNPIIELSPYLDMLELKQKVIPKEKINYLTLFMQNVNNSFLKEDAFGKDSGGFDSLPFIATRELHSKLDDVTKKRIFEQELDDGEIYESLKEELPDGTLKTYHKYIAIVQADGDNVGKIIKELTEFDEFSNKLLEFAKSSNKIIKDYGGSVIYAGGDDLLFFAPIVREEKHIFILLEEIRENFNKIFKKYIQAIEEKGDKEIPSLSFGLSISYYKYPLYEALLTATEELFEFAKVGEKDNIALKLLQHSGQYIKTTIYQSSKSYKEFKKLTELFLSLDEKKDILSSFHHTVRKLEDVLKAIGKDPKAVRNFFDNNFNEAHQDKYKEFTDVLVEYIITIFDEENNPDNAIKRLYTTLKLIKFLKGGEI